MDKNISLATNLPENFILTDEFLEAFNLMENTKKNIFLTGKAGTGKSTLIAYFRKNTKKRVAIISPTGIAAMNVGGQTIHSFFDFPLTYIDPDAIHESRKLQTIYRGIDTIIVDEVSMVRADMIDGMDKSLRINRGRDEPFGDVQMIFVGDMYQLPPVVADEDSSKYIKSNYPNEYFFSARAFDYQPTNLFIDASDYKLTRIELKNIFRQKDDIFKEILNSIRNKTFTDHHLEALNSRFSDDISFVRNNTNNLIITLATTNAIADKINATELSKIDAPAFTYKAEINGEFKRTVYPTNELLSLKVGAQIMMLKNDSERRWVNGSLGVIQSLDENSVKVMIQGRVYDVEIASWRVIRYQFNGVSQRLEEFEIGSFLQYPIKLAWAVTIHKSQGQTFERAIVDMGHGSFAHGQLYVALSRCKSLEGLYLKRKIFPRDIIVDQDILEWMI